MSQISENPWMQSLTGRAIDLLAPRVEDVDFREIADTLARINRYAGATRVPVSVALHTIIACDAAPDDLKPWVLLHDAHEAYIGDISTPVREAIFARIERDHGLSAIMKNALAEITWEHDATIHTAARLPLPTIDQFRGIKLVDVTALQTERRDFLAPPPRSWGYGIDLIEPLDTSYAAWPGTLGINGTAASLFALFKTYLPALRDT